MCMSVGGAGMGGPGSGAGIQLVSEWIKIVLLPSSYCLHGSVFPELAYSLDNLSKPSVHVLHVVLFTLKESLKLTSMISKDAEGTLKVWKEKL
eukprot:13780738-Ditylum_brightwellii.AAC.1